MHPSPGAGLLAAALLCLPLASTRGSAQATTSGDLVIESPWSRATPAEAKVAVGYVTIRNTGKAADRLVGGSFEAASGFELHDMSMDGGVMRMRPAGSLEIPAGGTLALAPSGQHIMLTGLKHRLAKGQAVDGTLVFERAGTVPVHFAIQGVGAKAPDASASPAGHAMPGMNMD